MKRRRFINTTLASSVLALGGLSAFQVYQQSLLDYPNDFKNDGADYQFLTPDDRLLLHVLIPVFVAGVSSRAAHDFKQVSQNIDQAIIQLALRTQQELRDLFDLLNSALGRLLLAQVWLNWQATEVEKLDQFLTEWRESSLDLLQIAYKGLHKLIIGSAYAEASSWDAIGYPGPPKLAGLSSTQPSTIAIHLGNRV